MRPIPYPHIRRNLLRVDGVRRAHAHRRRNTHRVRLRLRCPSPYASADLRPPYSAQSISLSASSTRAYTRSVPAHSNAPPSQVHVQYTDARADRTRKSSGRTSTPRACASTTASGACRSMKSMGRRSTRPTRTCATYAPCSHRSPPASPKGTDPRPYSVRSQTGGKRAGSCTAALFLKNFVDGVEPADGEDAPKIRWAHVDIAGSMEVRLSLLSLSLYIFRTEHEC